MPIINPVLPADGDDAVVEPYNAAITAILGVLNGNIDDSNISAVNGGKIAANSIPITAMNAAANQGWVPLANPPNSITNNGNRNYSLVFNAVDLTGILSLGARVKAIRSSAAPNQCANLNGSTQFFSNSAPSGLTFTNNWSASAWVKLSSYGVGSIISRFNGTNGFDWCVLATGQIQVFGANAGSGNFRGMTTNESLPLNRWVKVSFEMDMSGFTTTTCKMQIDDRDATVQLIQGGTNPTALVQAGNLEIGSRNGGTQPFPGELAQVELFNALISGSTLSSYSGQTITGSETNAVGAWALSNSLTDLSSSGNNLTANGAATTTTADSPFAQGVSAGTTEYGIVTGIVFSTNTTVTVQVPEGSMLPTSGSLSAIAYSLLRVPYGLPSDSIKWRVFLKSINDLTVSIGATNTWVSSNLSLPIPAGSWRIGYETVIGLQSTVAGTRNGNCVLSPPTVTASVYNQDLSAMLFNAASVVSAFSTIKRETSARLAAVTTYTIFGAIVSASGSESFSVLGTRGATIIYADNAYL